MIISPNCTTITENDCYRNDFKKSINTLKSSNNSTDTEHTIILKLSEIKNYNSYLNIKENTKDKFSIKDIIKNKRNKSSENISYCKSNSNVSLTSTPELTHRNYNPNFQQH